MSIILLCIMAMGLYALINVVEKRVLKKVLNMAIEDCRLKLQTQAAVSLPT